MFDGLHRRKKLQLFIGFIVGIIFGFLLQKGGATRYDIIIDQLILRDFTVLKIIFSAIITGMIGIYILKYLRLVKLHPKPCRIYPIIVGGLIFGIGFALLGYCPGTSVGALGTGSIHAAFGVLGILTGAALFAQLYTGIKERFYQKDLGNITIPDILGINPWIIILIFTIILAAIMYYLESIGY